LTVFTAQRIGEVVGARWDEFDLQAGTGAIPRARMKRKDADVIEMQLDHTIGTKRAAVYDRAQPLAMRRELMTWYEGQLLAARDGATVVLPHVEPERKSAAVHVVSPHACVWRATAGRVRRLTVRVRWARVPRRNSCCLQASRRAL
jgi:hypothetical protein